MSEGEGVQVRCYIAGPMTGYPGFNYAAFDEARDVLVGEGWDVISPADLDRENLGLDFSEMGGDEDLSEYRTAFARQDFAALLDVHAVYALDGWERSTGARNELTVAAMLGVPIYSFATRESIEWVAHFSNVAPPAPLSVRRELLLEAAELVDGDRNAQYGDPRQDFRRTASLWETYLDGKTSIEPHDVAAMMALLKLSRIRWSPEKRDSWTDLAGYAACGYHTVAPEAPPA